MTQHPKTQTSQTSHTQNNATTPIRHVKVAIIGAGTAGHNAYRQVRKATDSVVIINEGIWSTTCTTIGCMPSKLLIAAGERAHHAKHSDDFGIEGAATINGKQVMARVRRERDHFASYPLKNAAEWGEEHKIYGRAVIVNHAETKSALIAAHTATGATQLIAAEHMIIATGSKPFVPDGWRDSLGDLLITSDTIFELPDLPKSLAVIGTGAIGLELAQAMSRLGVAVALFNRSDNVGGIKDDKVNAKAVACLSNELDLRLNTSITAVRRQQGDGDNRSQAVIDYTDLNDTNMDDTNINNTAQTWTGDLVLVATGRRNSIDKMGLEHLGIELDDNNRPKDMDKSNGKIKDKNVYIVGDANAYRPLLHETSNEGYLAGLSVALRLNRANVDNGANVDNVDNVDNSDNVDNVDNVDNSDNDPAINIRNAIASDADISAQSPILADITEHKAQAPATLMSVIFSEPQIMAVGHTLKSIEARGIPYVIGEVSFENQGRSRIMGVNCGLLRLYVCQKDIRARHIEADDGSQENPKTRGNLQQGQILGACMVGPAAEYIAHILATAITNNVTVAGLLDSPFYHPTILEGLRTALRDAKGQLTANAND